MQCVLGTLCGRDVVWCRSKQFLFSSSGLTTVFRFSSSICSESHNKRKSLGEVAQVFMHGPNAHPPVSRPTAWKHWRKQRSKSRRHCCLMTTVVVTTAGDAAICRKWNPGNDDSGNKSRNQTRQIVYNECGETARAKRHGFKCQATQRHNGWVELWPIITAGAWRRLIQGHEAQMAP